jgi:hypothetical protein
MTKRDRDMARLEKENLKISKRIENVKGLYNHKKWVSIKYWRFNQNLVEPSSLSLLNFHLQNRQHL